MDPDKVNNPPLSLDQWAKWFKKELAPTDMEDACVLAYLRHFADLGIFKPYDANRWNLAGIEAGRLTFLTANKIRKHLEALSLTEAGFAISHFLGHSPKEPFPTTRKQPERQKAAFPERASDLSNLQIVKKVGRQLQPFLELEKKILSRLEGVHSTKEDARKIFTYILNRTQGKASPKKWEQLSRKRHR